ncbi:MAG: hypothetical protein IH596_03800 [Bacteroidales bacterium]|nr:hypothetical protein [Bacteroidales bacterium]
MIDRVYYKGRVILVQTICLISIMGFQITGLQAQNFQQFIDYLNALPENQRQAKVDSFMNAGHAFPYIETDTLVSFVYQGNGQAIAVAGDATVWVPDLDMLQVAGTDFWYYQAVYEPDARLDYKFVKNGATWLLDPLNPWTCTGGYGPNSELRMPACTIPPEIAYYPAIPHGTLHDTLFHSTNLGNSRTVKIYLPAGYDTATKAYPVILFHDGLEFITLGEAPNILDYLISHQMMVPVIAIFVPPVNRTQEYAGSQKEPFRKFIIEELMPVYDTKYRIETDPQKRAMIGASNGGNISLYIGMKNPESFGRIATQSSNVQTEISNTFQGSDKLDLELYLDIGKYDIPALIPLVANLVTILEAKEYDFQHFIFNEGHSYCNWRDHLRLPLIQFFPFNTGIKEDRGQLDFELNQNYPNPFRDQTTIPFSLTPGTEATLVLQTMSGQHLETLASGLFNQPTNEVVFHPKNYPSGSYHYTLFVKGASQSKTLTIIR